MSAFSNIDLSKLPLPDAIDELDPEAIFQRMKDRLAVSAPELARVLELESEPTAKALQEVAYLAYICRQEHNDDVRAQHLATALGSDLDALGSYLGVARFTLQEADPEAIPPIPEVLESDDAFRRRIQLAPEAFSNAGSKGAYTFHALGADPEIKDVSVKRGQPGEVIITVLSNDADGTPSAGALTAVEETCNGETIRPISDNLTVQAATIVPVSIDATLTFEDGPDRALVMAAAEAELALYLVKQQSIGRDVTRAGIIAALYQPGVSNVMLAAPAADIVITDEEAPYTDPAGAVTLTDGGVNV